MKAKIINALTIVTAISITASAQSYQPFPTDFARWEVARCWYFYQPGWYDNYTFEMDGSDTLYNGESFKKIYITNHHLPGTEFDTIYPTEFFGGLKESNKQIFIYQVWASTDTTVQLVYDFNNTEIGDTIFTNVLSGNPNLFGHLVTGIDSVLIGNQYHKRLHLQDPDNSYNTESWIEGVGSSWGLPFATFWSITDNSYDLTCFYADQQLKYENPAPVYGYCQAPHPVITCDPISALHERPALKSILFTLYPNPAADVVTLNIDPPYNKDLELTIYNFTGVVVFSEKLKLDQSEINIHDLSNGIYFAVIRSNDSIGSHKIVIQR